LIDLLIVGLIDVLTGAVVSKLKAMTHLSNTSYRV